MNPPWIRHCFPLVVSAAVWGSSWHGSRVSFLSDNQAVVHVLSSRSAKDPALAHLMRCLFFLRPSSVLSTQPPISRVPTTLLLMRSHVIAYLTSTLFSLRHLISLYQSHLPLLHSFWTTHYPGPRHAGRSCSKTLYGGYLCSHPHILISPVPILQLLHFI